MRLGQSEFRRADELLGAEGSKRIPETVCSNFGNLYVIAALVDYADLDNPGVGTDFWELAGVNGALDDMRDMGWVDEHGSLNISISCSTANMGNGCCMLSYIVRSQNSDHNMKYADELEIVKGIVGDATVDLASIMKGLDVEGETVSEEPKLEAVAELSLDERHFWALKQACRDLPVGVYGEKLSARKTFLDALEVRVMPFLASSSLGEEIQNLRHGRRDILVMSGLVTDAELPATPKNGMPPLDKKTYVSEAIGLGIGRLLGYPSAMMREQGEALVHQIAPTPEGANSQSNAGVVALRHHQDMAPSMEMPDVNYAEFMPDFLILVGLRENLAEPTETYVASVAEIVELLDDEVLKVLSEERFVTNPPDSFVREGVSKDAAPAHAVLSLHNGNYESAYDSSSGLRPVDASDEEAELALKAFNDAVEECKRAVVIAPGTVVAFANRRTIHARGPLVGNDFDADERRWLQRVYVYDVERVLRRTDQLMSAFRRMAVNIGGGFMTVLPADGTDISLPADVPERIARLQG